MSTFSLLVFPNFGFRSIKILHDLGILSLNYEKAHLICIGNIAAKFEEATPCSYRDMLQTKNIETPALKPLILRN